MYDKTRQMAYRQNLEHLTMQYRRRQCCMHPMPPLLDQAIHDLDRVVPVANQQLVVSPVSYQFNRRIPRRLPSLFHRLQTEKRPIDRAYQTTM